MSRQNVEVLVGHAQDISIKAKNHQLVNEAVFPMVEMVSPKQKITIYDRDEQFQSGAHERAPGRAVRRPARGSGRRFQGRRTGLDEPGAYRLTAQTGRVLRHKQPGWAAAAASADGDRQGRTGRSGRSGCRGR